MGPEYGFSAILHSWPSDNLSMALSTWKPVSIGILPNHLYSDTLCKPLCTACFWPEGSHQAATLSASPPPSTFGLPVPRGSLIYCKTTVHPYYWLLICSHIRTSKGANFLPSDYKSVLACLNSELLGSGQNYISNKESPLTCPPLNTLPQTQGTM